MHTFSPSSSAKKLCDGGPDTVMKSFILFYAWYVMLENFEILLMFYLHTILHANVNLGRALKPFLNKVDKFENNKTK